MQKALKGLLVRTLHSIANSIDADTCELTEDEAYQMLNAISHRPLTKSQAANYLNVSRATFDNYIKDGFVSKGKKRKGLKELIWYEDELNKLLIKM